MATKITRSRTLLNPNEKAGKYAQELKTGLKMTNDGIIKTNSDGTQQKLTEKEREFRKGYLSSRRESADMYKYKKAIGEGKSKQEAKALSFGATRAKRRASRSQKKN